MSVNWTRAEPINGIAYPPNINPTVLEEYKLIFFGSRQQQNIYITAHGVDDGKQFTPARACQFYLAHGGRLTWHSRTYPAFAGGMPPANQLHAANAPNCHNYKLLKYQGRHSADAMMGFAETYKNLAMKSAQHNATFVTVRNRLGSGYVRLQTAITRIIANCPNVVTIHCLFCRETTPAIAANDAVACPPGCFTCG